MRVNAMFHSRLHGLIGWVAVGIALVCLGIVGPALSAETVEVRWDKPRKINKIYLMYHPVCWAMNSGEAKPNLNQKTPEEKLAWFYGYEREKQVNKLQKQLMDTMKPDEALVIFPIGGGHHSMLDLEWHGSEVLGRRCIIVRREGWSAPASWDKIPDRMQKFLDDPNLEGKAEFLKPVPPEIQKELETEIREACKTLGYNWSASCFKVIYYQRMVAEDLKNEFKDRGLYYDPKTVQCEAFGEGFEECATTWKSMLIHYMGIQHPAQNIYDLSVTGTKLLFGSKFKERVQLDKDICLYLWEGADGRPIGLYARSWCRLKDPQYYAEVAWKGEPLEVYMTNSKYFPPSNALIQMENELLTVPIYMGIRRGHEKDKDQPYYITASNITFEEFRGRLVGAKIH